MEITAILLRTSFMYIFIFIIMRMMGKREIGKLSVFDLVISIMIAEIAVIVIESTENSLWTAISPILLLALIQIGIAFLTLKNNKLRALIDGRPSVLVRHGRLNRREMSKQRYNLDDLMSQLRESGVIDLTQVELAVLESTGKLSVITKEDTPYGEATAKRGGEIDSPSGADGFPKVRFELLPIALILDGQVQDDTLEEIGKNRFWLKKELHGYGVDSFKDVFFCSIDHRGKLYVDKKTRL
ncbi:YetF domain-containing protein [Cohnella yongneupensis]|uniref:YetF domain-containing protein n=1 Tax=Cohnella yongneupensis TaxID=425006 RepID=A0ABW0QYW7_9BACL